MTEPADGRRFNGCSELGDKSLCVKILDLSPDRARIKPHQLEAASIAEQFALIATIRNITRDI